jgi:hypothetical protein
MSALLMFEPIDEFSWILFVNILLLEAISPLYWIISNMVINVNTWGGSDITATEGFWNLVW